MMATAPRSRMDRKIEYPTSDGKPMAETEIHRDLMMDLIRTLQRHFAGDPMVCVSGNLLMYYEEGDKWRHVSPDVFVVFGIEKRTRLNYLVWDEGKGPDVVIELTSRSTSSEDQKGKKQLYQDVLKVPEYFLFDPTEENLHPSLQGFRLVEDQYEPIESIEDRLPSALLGLHLERVGNQLRLHNPATGQRLPTPAEFEADLVTRAAEFAARATGAEARAAGVETENERLRREVEELRRRLSGGD